MLHTVRGSAPIRRLGFANISGFARAIMFAHRNHIGGGIEGSAWQLWSLPAALEHLKLFVAERAGLAGKCAVLDVACPAVLVPQPIIETAIPTLVQLLRNAIEHGVETPVARLVAGKPLTATIKLGVSLEAGRISVRIHDDGTGIDCEAVLGLERSLAPVASDGRSGPDHDARRAVLARHGIVASVRNERSGSGLQRAVARIAPLRGKLSFASKPGKGTTFSLSIDAGEISRVRLFDLAGLSGSAAGRSAQ
ncbi:MAG: ATP-binding protein [Alphaproteobacteria bacterium]